MNVPIVPTPTPATGAPAPAPAPAAPEPGTPEHRAAMIAAYDAQNQTPAPSPAPAQAPAAAPAADEVKPVVDPNAPTPKLTDAPADAPKDGETPPDASKDGSEPPAVPKISEAFADVMAGIGAEKVPDNVANVLKGAGFEPEQITALNERMRGLLALEAQVNATKLHTAAGGAEKFNALVAWGQKNLSPQEREFYDSQLNGPSAAAAIEVLTARMTKAVGIDPNIKTVNGTGTPTVQGYRSAAEMQRDMRDPRYQTDPAFRADVREKLRHAKY